MTEFREEDSVPSAGEQANGVDGTETRRALVLARAEAAIARVDAMERAERHQPGRVAVTKAMPDLETLQQRWTTGVDLSDEEFCKMRHLESLAKTEPAPPPPKLRTVACAAPVARRANENLFERARLSELELKLKAGGRWTDVERVEWWNLNARNLMLEVDDLVGKRRVTQAIARVVKQFAIVAIQQTQNRERLEDRISALEPKPRIRVKAIQQVIA